MKQKSKIIPFEVMLLLGDIRNCGKFYQLCLVMIKVECYFLFNKDYAQFEVLKNALVNKYDTIISGWSV